MRVIGLLLDGGDFVCDACVNEIEHDVMGAQPVHAGEAPDAICVECGDIGMYTGADTLEEAWV